MKKKKEMRLRMLGNVEEMLRETLAKIDRRGTDAGDEKTPGDSSSDV